MNAENLARCGRPDRIAGALLNQSLAVLANIKFQSIYGRTKAVSI
jgi:hypothetical protein